MKPYWFIRHWFLNRWWIWPYVRWERCNAFVCLGFPGTQPHMTTSWSRSHLQQLWFSGDLMKSLYRRTKCCRCRWGCIIFSWQLDESWYLQFGLRDGRISLTQVVGHVSPAWLNQLGKLHLLLPKMHHPILYHFGPCSLHPAGVVIFAHLAQLRIFLITILVFPILPLIGTFKIAQTISDGIQNFLKCCFKLCGC